MICSRELTAFYDPQSRKNLEKILESKIASQKREFFTFGTLEEEIKKIARIAGANDVIIKSADDLDKSDLNTAQSVISYDTDSNKIGQVIKNFLNSKKYKVILKPRLVITDAKLFPDES